MEIDMKQTPTRLYRHGLRGSIALFVGLLSIAAGPAAGPGPANPPAAGDDIPKVSTEGMTPSERDALKRLMQKFPSPCGKPHSLLTSLRTDPKCNLSVHAGKWMAKMFSDGFLESEVDEKYNKRFVEAKC